MPVGTAADAKLFASWLSAVRSVLNPHGIRLTADVASWSPVLKQYATLAPAVDRLQTMSTYNDASLAQWNADFHAFVDAIPRSAAGVGLGVWNDSKSQWWETAAGAKAKVAVAIKGGIMELACFRLVPAPDNESPSSFWWDALAPFIGHVSTSPHAPITCTDKIYNASSIYQGATLVASLNLSDQGACCASCHQTYKDECVAWEWTGKATGSHNCDLFAKVGPVKSGFPGRVSGISPHVPQPPPPPPGPVGAPCHNDGDCAASWGGVNWRCLAHSAPASAANGCHMHALTHNSTCACQPSGCGGGGSLEAAGRRSDFEDGAIKYLVIGDSISEGMQADLTALLQPDGWTLDHNPGNGDNSNFGAHCVSSWTSSAYDVISFQFGLHDIAHDEERLSVSQYTERLMNITAHLVTVQKQYGTKLLWVKTTPVQLKALYLHWLHCGILSVPAHLLARRCRR